MDRGSVALASGMESPTTQVDPSHWSVHLLECFTTTFLLIVVILVGVLWVLRCLALCCWAGKVEGGRGGPTGVMVPMGPGVSLAEMRPAVAEPQTLGSEGRFRPM